MASRYEVEVTVTSASDLKNVNWRHGPVKPYAVVWVDPARKVSSRVDDEGDTCPRWDQKLIVPLDRPIEDATLYVDIVHAYAAEDTKPLIGSAKLPLREIVDDVGIGGRATRRLQLKRPSGRPQGKVEVHVAVRDSRYRSPDPYNAPPYGVRDAPPYSAAPTYGVRDAPPYAAPYAPQYSAAPPLPAYAAPPSGYPYAQPDYSQRSYGQPAGYGYGQPAGYGYGQPGQVVEEKKKGKFGGMGMGTGLAVGAVAGALGGLALAEGIDKLEDHVADEAADKVEADLAARDDDYVYYDGGDDEW